MPDPFHNAPPEAPADVGAPGNDAHPEWTAELIASLDWLRLAELVRSIAANAGCELAGSRVLADGGVVFGMIEQPHTSQPQRALVRLAAWNERGATPESLLHFAQEIRTAQDTRGIFIAPGGFGTAALQTAQEHRIELVDAAALAAVLLNLPPERSRLFHTIATAGEYTRPTCPVCLKKLSRTDASETGGPASVEVISEQGLFAGRVNCALLDIPEEAEVEFLYPVHARGIRVRGKATGDFTCDGTVTIEPGGLLDGRLAARAVDVLEGGELRGRFRILEGACHEPFATVPVRWHWTCRDETPGEARPAACARVRFEAHL